MFYYLSIEAQLKILFEKEILPVEKSQFCVDDSFIVDFKDGELYKHFSQSFSKTRFEYVYSFGINTDGISLCSKSCLSIWPIYITINEINKNWRFNQECVIHAGMYVGYQKPPIDKFFEPIVKQLLDLENGFFFDNNIYYFYLLNACFDKPARALVSNLNSSSGYFGCLKCLHPGESVSFGEGHHIIYDPINVFPKRSKINYLHDLAECNKIKKTFNGIKGDCILNKLKYFNVIESTDIDAMHSLWLGFGKLLLTYLIQHKSSSKYSLKNKLGLLNSQLLSCKPPNYVAQAPRGFETLSNWRAHEYMNFYLFFAIPTFKGIMSEEYYEHLLLLIISIERLFSKQIEKIILPKIHQMLRQFVLELEMLYDKHLLVSGTHELLHLVECTISQGPRNDTSLFEFEELNRKITTSIKGQSLVGDEFIKKWSVSLNLSAEINLLNAKDDCNIFYDYIRKTFKIRSSNDKNSYDSINFRYGKIRHIDFFDLEVNLLELVCKSYKIESQTEAELENIESYFNIYLNTIQYSIYDSTTKFCNSVINFDNQVGLVEIITKDYLFCRTLLLVDNNLYHKDFKGLKSFYGVYQLTKRFFIVELKHLLKSKKLFLKKLDSILCLVSLLSTSHLFS